jgi:isoleucyl-tRNA synthetase
VLKKLLKPIDLLRNSLRFQLSNLYDYDPEKHAVDHDQLTPLDRWMLDAWSRLEQEVYDAFSRYEFHIVYQKVSQFTAVEISSVYHDLVKDRLYSDAAESHARRSTQTVLHHIVRQLCQMLSPMLVFTSDEAWEFIPGVTDGDSVHLQEWKPSSFKLSEQENSDWVRWMALRDQVLAKLEDARRDKVIGKSLEAKVTVQIPADELNTLKENHAVIKEIMNVSQLEWTEGEALDIQVAKADGSKCKRCWHWEMEVGSHEQHPEICNRCVEAVESQTASA